jgi:two-component system chemotaxis response regulator CheB
MFHYPEKDNSFTLDYSERVNYSRPSIDVVFQSAAEVYGQRTVGIVLSGANADGTEGCQYIRQKGGIAIAQRPDSAEVPYMPENAIANMAVDRVMNVDEMAAYLNQLT